MHRPDYIVESDVKDELDWDPLVDSTQIIVRAEHGHVTLTGAVPSYYNLLRAKEDAESVRGVTAVSNELLVGPVGKAIADEHVTAACASALAAEKWVPKSAVTVEVDNGWVTLRGTVHHHYQRQSAEHAVSQVDGVVGITNHVSISRGPVPNDVVERINQAFARDAVINGSDIRVSSEGHTVFLDGTAKSSAAVHDAIDTAWEAPGVQEVISRLVVAL